MGQSTLLPLKDIRRHRGAARGAGRYHEEHDRRRTGHSKESEKWPTKKGEPEKLSLVRVDLFRAREKDHIPTPPRAMTKLFEPPCVRQSRRPLEKTSAG
jgi:hypothetical protein